MPLKELPAASRPREKLLARGPQALSDAELLAIVLRTGIQGKGVLQLASELLSPATKQDSCNTSALQTLHEPGAHRGSVPQGGFGGLSGLLHASEGDLRRIKGLGPAKRAELLAVLELARRAMAEQLETGVQFESPDTVRGYLALHLAARAHEVFAVLFLDVQHRLIAMEELFRGTLTQTQVYPREVVLRALHHQASAVVLAHNHPSGNVQASAADVQLTLALKRALALVDVRVLDHFIVTQGKVSSMAEEGSI